jgi:hypothetical protein
MDQRLDGSLAQQFDGQWLSGLTVDGATALQLGSLTVRWLDGLLA